MVMCPKCDREHDLNKDDCCGNCGLDIAFVLSRVDADEAVDKIKAERAKARLPQESEKKKSTMRAKLGG